MSITTSTAFLPHALANTELQGQPEVVSPSDLHTLSPNTLDWLQRTESGSPLSRDANSLEEKESTRRAKQERKRRLELKKAYGRLRSVLPDYLKPRTNTTQLLDAVTEYIRNLSAQEISLIAQESHLRSRLNDAEQEIRELRESQNSIMKHLLAIAEEHLKRI
ncbi:hypothetical protein VKT23_004635 [Stygiomarasmius scandens]|uniref:BHLH domain-containing protein n=1 Tax=Marasmiellus scandens TaxID=2682957 RepID=A0ABR1K139_9AGAR